MASKGNHVTHTTALELDFIRNMGRYAGRQVPRVKLLEGYLDGALKRRNWDKIDELQVIKTVSDEIRKCYTGRRGLRVVRS